MLKLLAPILLLALTACGTTGSPSRDDELLLLLGTGFLSGANQARGYNQPPRPLVSTTCSTVGQTVNCLSF